MSVLRVYEPAECDEHGVPLDWEQCRACRGRGMRLPGGTAGPQLSDNAEIPRPVPCDLSGGHGSLKAAALDACWAREDGSGAATVGADRRVVLRCEDCGHPMSDGTWEGESLHTDRDHSTFAEAAFRAGQEPLDTRVHYSPCDEGCRHDYVSEENTGLRWCYADPPFGVVHEPVPFAAFEDEPAATEGVRAVIRMAGAIEASWRQVDVRCLSGPHDLRPEKLAVLCLRCWAARR